MALPRVIAGPIVRRVERTTCSFWVVLREAATVTARIWQGHQTAPVADSVQLIASGELATRAVGTNLHVAVVTVDTSGTPLDPGGLYSYDLSFRIGSTTTNLKDEGLLEDESPTRAPRRRRSDGPAAPRPRLPAGPAAVVPRAAGHVRPDLAADGRRRSAPGPRQLPAPRQRGGRRARRHRRAGGRRRAAAAPAVPHGRPGLRRRHLGGVPPARHRARQRTGRRPVPARVPRRPAARRVADAGDGEPARIGGQPARPMRRKWLLWQLAGFTGGDTANHSIAFPEFVALHLLAWSPRVWRADPDVRRRLRHRRWAAPSPGDRAVVEPAVVVHATASTTSDGMAEADAAERARRKRRVPGPTRR